MPIFKPEISFDETYYYEIRPGFIVPVRIKEISLSVTLTEEYAKFLEVNKHTWMYVFPTYIIVGDEKIRHEDFDSKNFESFGIQFFWIDEIVGHGITFYDNDGLFRNLSDAYKNSRKIDSRQAKRAHRKIQSARNYRAECLRKNYRSTGGDPSGVKTVTTKKRIYPNIGRKCINE